MKYIGEHYRDITLDQVAKEFNYHPDYLSYRFKKITGMSFSKKLLSIRMEESTTKSNSDRLCNEL